MIAAGMRDVIVIKQRQLARLQSPGPRGCILTNPPYGERLSDKEVVKYLYRCLGRTFRDQFDGWTLGFFTANPDLAEMTGMQLARAAPVLQRADQVPAAGGQGESD